MEEKRKRKRRLRKKKIPINKVEPTPVQKGKAKKTVVLSDPLLEKKRIQDRNKKYEQTRKRMTIAFDFDEWEKIEDQLEEGELTFTEFAKHKLLKAKIKFPAALKNDAAKISASQKIHSELLAQGNNLNQLAKKMNQGDPLNIQFLQLLSAIEKQLGEIKKKT